MPLYVYRKSLPEDAIIPPKSPPPFHFHLAATLVSVFGLVLIAFVVWPILSYELSSSQTRPPKTQSDLLTPLVESGTALASFAPAPKVVGSLDYTKAGNWFPQASPQSASASVDMVSYTLSIPKLRIENALVRLDNDDLAKSLVHYPGTAHPGELGSPVIFGHSILPQFYNPKNYMSIFSLLPTLELGDEIRIDHDNVSYTYQVSKKQEVFPEDLWILEQRYDQKTLKLITCVPPGLKTRRLVVTAQLVKT